jgi:large subunit ribosomal protein L22
MPTHKISIIGLDKDRTAVATGRDLRISPKASREICKALKGMTIEQANKYLDDVIALKKSVPFKRHNKNMSHRGDLIGWHSGRYPQKACREFKKVLENLENNAIFKNLDSERMRLIHIISHRARKIQGITPRAQGRGSPKIKTLTHIEVVGEEF